MTTEQFKLKFRMLREGSKPKADAQLFVVDRTVGVKEIGNLDFRQIQSIEELVGRPPERVYEIRGKRKLNKEVANKVINYFYSIFHETDGLARKDYERGVEVRLVV
ncbi:MAG: hypothetical protein U9Q06_01775 [Nanoarchaeota archaeon]|nr:hypothetical protein [Nanoarchaeota archaeon]